MTNNDKTYKIVVLGDGETWDHLAHADIMTVTEEGFQRLRDGVAPIDLANDDVVEEAPLWSIAGGEIISDCT